MKQPFLIALFTLSILSVQACAENPTEKLLIEKANGKNLALNVEVADEPDEWAQGLMNRTHLDADSGMLFSFPRLRQPSFWMKNTLIPLDMIFIGANNTIQQIHPNAIPGDLTWITARKPARAVLELNGGMAEKLGLQVGDKVSAPSLVKLLELR